ncbi:MAG: type IX secretion system membrane protein PorP/SprF [Cytophagaceae bacterium]
MHSFRRQFYLLPVIWVLVLGSTVSVRAQDAHFSQYYSSALYLNPSMAGVYPGPTFSSNYRSQWGSIAVPYTTSQISLIMPLYAKREFDDAHLGGLGLSVYNDRAGDGNLKTTGINFNAAYNLPLSANRMQSLIFGVQGGFIQKNIDFANLQWGEQYNPYLGDFDQSITPNESNIRTRATYPDVGAGLMYYYNAGRNFEEKGLSGYLGFSAYHLNRPNESMISGMVSNLPMLFKAHAGVEFKVGQKVNFSPNLLVMQQGDFRLFNGGAYLTYQFLDQRKYLAPSDVIFGAWYRLKDSFIFAVGFGNQSYTLGFSYDYNNSTLRANTGGRGAYEISLVLTKIKEKRIRRFYTPRI